MKIKLTNKQWASFDRKLAMEEDPLSSLPICCANISTLRDTIIAIKEDGGNVSAENLHNLEMHWGWCIDGHDFDDEKYKSFKPLRSVIEQAGLEWKPKV